MFGWLKHCFKSPQPPQPQWPQCFRNDLEEKKGGEPPSIICFWKDKITVYSGEGMVSTFSYDALPPEHPFSRSNLELNPPGAVTATKDASDIGC